MQSSSYDSCRITDGPVTENALSPTLWRRRSSCVVLPSLPSRRDKQREVGSLVSQNQHPVPQEGAMHTGHLSPQQFVSKLPPVTAMGSSVLSLHLTSPLDTLDYATRLTRQLAVLRARDSSLLPLLHDGKAPYAPDRRYSYCAPLRSDRRALRELEQVASSPSDGVTLSPLLQSPLLMSVEPDSQSSTSPVLVVRRLSPAAAHAAACSAAHQSCRLPRLHSPLTPLRSESLSSIEQCDLNSSSNAASCRSGAPVSTSSFNAGDTANRPPAAAIGCPPMFEDQSSLDTWMTVLADFRRVKDDEMAAQHSARQIHRPMVCSPLVNARSMHAPSGTSSLDTDRKPTIF